MVDEKADEGIVAVNCSYCGKEIECPENMLAQAEKHACVACFENLSQDKNDHTKIHVDIPLKMDNAIKNMAGDFAEKQVEEVFPEIWAEHREEIQRIHLIRLPVFVNPLSGEFTKEVTQSSKFAIKEMSKKEVAQRMFDEGLYMGFIWAFAYREAMAEDDSEEEDEKK